MARGLEEGLDAPSAYWLAQWLSVVLAALTIFFDVISEKFSEYLESKADLKEEEFDFNERKTLARFMLKLWGRFRAELTTLGFIAFTVYIFHEFDFFHWVVEASHAIHPPLDEQVFYDELA